jgi:hypothetical protein
MNCDAVQEVTASRAHSHEVRVVTLQVVQHLTEGAWRRFKDGRANGGTRRCEQVDLDAD